MSDKKLFDEIYKSSFSKIYAYFSTCLGRDAAEDLSQQVFLKIWRRIGRPGFQKPDNILSWVFKAAVNVKNDYFRNHYRQPQTEELPDESIPASDMENDFTERLAIENALSIIKPQEKDLLLLKASGLTSGDIGTILGISASAVRSRLALARKHLTQSLLDCGVNIHETE